MSPATNARDFAATQSQHGSADQSAMPAQLRDAIRSLSGEDLSDVTVHHNAREPETVDAFAFAMGNEIFLGPGQENLMAHEAWHIVQQRQGRVPETRHEAGASINDDPALEQEAEIMAVLAGESTSQSTGKALRQDFHPAFSKLLGDRSRPALDGTSRALQRHRRQDFAPAIPIIAPPIAELLVAAAAAIVIAAGQDPIPLPRLPEPKPLPVPKANTGVGEVAIMMAEAVRRGRKLADMRDILNGLKVELANCLAGATELQKADENCQAKVDAANDAINLGLRRVYHFSRKLLLFTPIREAELEGLITDAESKYVEAMMCLGCPF